MNYLPLSWTVSENYLFNNTVQSTKYCWLSEVSIQKNKDITTSFQSIFENYSSNVIIKGCNTEIKNILEKRGFASMQLGLEAVIDTNCNTFEKKSLLKLVNRGLKKGEIIKLNYSEENKSHLNEFLKTYHHAKEPQLKNLFITKFNPGNKLYVLKKDKHWLGAVLVSNNSIDKIHTELILRTHNSPVGTIESIIYAIYNDTVKQNIRYLSLGEVPFINQINYSSDSLYTILSTISGRFLKFAYNYKGLQNFKAKFNPMWEPVYICTSKKISFRLLLFLLVESNFLQLIYYKLVSKK